MSKQSLFDIFKCIFYITLRAWFALNICQHQLQLAAAQMIFVCSSCGLTVLLTTSTIATSQFFQQEPFACCLHTWCSSVSVAFIQNTHSGMKLLVCGCGTAAWNVWLTDWWHQFTLWMMCRRASTAWSDTPHNGRSRHPQRLQDVRVSACRNNERSQVHSFSLTPL